MLIYFNKVIKAILSCFIFELRPLYLSFETVPLNQGRQTRETKI